MSLEVLLWAFKQTHLSPTQKVVLLDLAERTGENRPCFPAVATIAQRCNVTPRTVTTTLGQLERMGLVRIGRYDGQRNNYNLLWRARTTHENSAPLKNSDEAPEIYDEDSGGCEPGDTEICDETPLKSDAVYIDNLPSKRTSQESSLRSESSVSQKRAAPKVKGWREDPAFKTFYAAYPRHDAPADAWKSWQRALKAATAAEIMAGLRRYRFDERPQFIPMPATWLNQERWLAEPTQPPPQSRGWNNTTSNGF